jgi:hypothetical protein
MCAGEMSMATCVPSGSTVTFPGGKVRFFAWEADGELWFRIAGVEILSRDLVRVLYPDPLPSPADSDSGMFGPSVIFRKDISDDEIKNLIAKLSGDMDKEITKQALLVGVFNAAFEKDLPSPDTRRVLELENAQEPTSSLTARSSLSS